MENKSLIWIGMSVGGAIGGYVPVLFGGSEFSFSSIIFGAIGSIVGIYIAFKMTQ